MSLRVKGISGWDGMTLFVVLLKILERGIFMGLDYAWYETNIIKIKKINFVNFLLRKPLRRGPKKSHEALKRTSNID